jgi:hypothetical protein
MYSLYSRIINKGSRVDMEKLKRNCGICKGDFLQTGHKKTRVQMFCSRSCSSVYAAKKKHEKIENTKENNPNWKGGISKNNYAYKLTDKRRYPEKHKARELFSSAIRRGKIVRPDRCEDCNELADVVGHHEDYSKPLDVNFLCRPCHRKRHDGKH